MRVLNKFVEIIRKNTGYELCGRIIREKEELVIFIDEIGKFVLSSGKVSAILLGLGECMMSGPVPGVARLSDSSRGFYLDIGDASYVIPVSRVRAVMSGEHRKGPVSKVL